MSNSNQSLVVAMNNREWIDVSSLFSVIIPFTLDDIDPMKSNVLISDRTYSSMISFDVSRFISLKELIIEDECFENVNEVMVNGLNELKYIQIGINSFTHLKSNSRWSNTLARNESRSFSVLNCGELESIEIGRYSFSDYGGGFELKNLPKLSIIKIGEIGRDSCNFYYSSFVVKGIIDVVIASE